MEPPIELVERIVSEGPIGLAAAAKLYGVYRGDRPTAPSTPYRHHTKGVPLADGTIVKLEAIRISGRVMTSRAAVLRFFAAQNSATNPQPVKNVPRRERQAAADAAEKELDALGVK